jgi:uncharacterized membrane-anchored protein YhcB (DUF1043 family)
MPATRYTPDLDKLKEQLDEVRAKLSESLEASREIFEAVSRDIQGVLNRMARTADGARTMVAKDAASRPNEVKRMSHKDIEQRLREFERAWAKSSGEQLSSDDFYKRYCSGEFDSRFGMRWATYFEVARSDARTTVASST